MATDNYAIPLTSKRVAIVLSTRTVEALDRFRKMRQGLIDATAKMSDPSGKRAEFIKLSAPEQFLTGVASAVDAAGAKTFAADDLSVLKNGGADYVLALDWNFTGNFNLSQKEFEAVPGCDKKKPDTCRILFKQSAAAWLVNSQLKAVRRIDDALVADAEWYFVAKEPKDTFAGYFSSLAAHFYSAWDLRVGGFHLVLQQSIAR